MIKHDCGKCGVTLGVDEWMAGKTGLCFSCKSPVVVPGEAESSLELRFEIGEWKESESAGLRLPVEAAEDVAKAKLETWVEETFSEIPEKKLRRQASPSRSISRGRIRDQTKGGKERDQLICPKCRSGETFGVVQGFDPGKAIIGAWLTGHLLGALYGNDGTGEVVNRCRACGHGWSPQRQG